MRKVVARVIPGFKPALPMALIRASMAWLVAAILCAVITPANAQAIHVLLVDTSVAGTVRVSIDGVDPASKAEGFALQIGGSAPIKASTAETAASTTPPHTRLVVCIDKSGSMGSATIEAVKSTLIGYFSKPHPGLEVGIIGFGSATKTVVGFGATPEVITARLREVAAESRDSKTKLYEAISGGIDQLRSGDDVSARRLLVISDGKDEGSDIGIERLVEKARSAKVVIDAIGIGRIAPTSSSSLVSLADRTNGNFELDKVADANFAATFAALIGKAPLSKPPTVVTFKYPVNADAARAEHAVLLYGAANAAQATQTIDGAFSVPTTVAAVAPAAGPSPASPAPGGSGRVEPPSRLEILINFKFPLVPILAVLVVAALVLWLASKLIKGPGGDGDGTVEPGPSKQTTAVVPPTGRPGPARSQERQTRFARYVFPAPRSGSPAAVLAGRSGPIGGRFVPIETELFGIGADAANQLPLGGDDFVSGNHALIRFDSGSLYLSDRGSRNGTFLNGTRLTTVPMSLSLGDELRVGKSVMVLEAGRGATADAPQAEGSIA